MAYYPRQRRYKIRKGDIKTTMIIVTYRPNKGWMITQDSTNQLVAAIRNINQKGEAYLLQVSQLWFDDLKELILWSHQ